MGTQHASVPEEKLHTLLYDVTASPRVLANRRYTLAGDVNVAPDLGARQEKR